MATAFRASSVLATGTRTASAVPVPAGVAANDVVIVHLYFEDSTPTVTPPAGFTELTFTTAPVTTANGIQRQRVFWKRATGADTGTYSFTHTSAITEGIGSAYTGCATTGTPVEVLASAVDSSASVLSPPAVSGTASLAGELLVYAVTAYNFGNNLTTPSTFSSVNTWGPGLASYKVQAAAGATGSVQAAGSGSASNFTVTLIGLLPPVTAPAGTISADLTGSGTLTATATPALARAGALTGSGALTATTAPALARTGALSGSGTLTATVAPALARSVALSGSGTLTAAAVPSLTRAVNLTGSGTLTATANGVSVPAGTVSAALSGTGDLTATTSFTVPVSVTVNASLTGEGALTATVTQTVPVWRLNTPTSEVTFRFAGGMNIAQTYGRSMWRINGQWSVGMSPAAELIAQADRFYAGGRLHTLSLDERDELVAAGFGDYITQEIL